MAIRTEDAETITSAFEALAILIGDAFRGAVSRAESAEAKALDADAKAADAETKAAAAEAILAGQADSEARLNAVVDRLTVAYTQLKDAVPAQG